MRTLILLVLFAIPPLVACGAASATSATGITRPVCSRFDESAKPMRHSSPAVPSANATEKAGVATVPTPEANTTRGGGVDDIRNGGAPHFQAFLPGMFR